MLSILGRFTAHPDRQCGLVAIQQKDLENSAIVMSKRFCSSALRKLLTSAFYCGAGKRLDCRRILSTTGIAVSGHRGIAASRLLTVKFELRIMHQ